MKVLITESKAASTISPPKEIAVVKGEIGAKKQLNKTVLITNAYLLVMSIFLKHRKILLGRKEFVMAPRPALTIERKKTSETNPPLYEKIWKISFDCSDAFFTFCEKVSCICESCVGSGNQIRIKYNQHHAGQIRGNHSVEDSFFRGHSNFPAFEWSYSDLHEPISCHYN